MSKTLNLTPERMAERRKALQDLYDDGYRYLCRTNFVDDDVLAGKSYGVRIAPLGIWAMEDALLIDKKGIDISLFPDVQQSDTEPFRIEDGLK